jgi:response regulator RpfG family c-di-GMP phosphodiesterase
VRRSATPSGRPTSSGTGKASPAGCAGLRSACPPGSCIWPARSKCSAAAVSARTIARRHSGTEFDPAVVDLFCAHAPELLAGLDEAADWDAVLDAEPELSRRVAGDELDDVLEGMADLVDLKSPYLAGHSRGVANLAEEAARRSGMPEDDVRTLRRGALVHDLGRLGVSNSIWDKPAALGDAELERVRLHPYLTDRMLARVAALSRSREIASRHHERLDGSGYPRPTGRSRTTSW